MHLHETEAEKELPLGDGCNPQAFLSKERGEKLQLHDYIIKESEQIF